MVASDRYRQAVDRLRNDGDPQTAFTRDQDIEWSAYRLVVVGTHASNWG